jgi:hypothetical protein
MTIAYTITDAINGFPPAADQAEVFPELINVWNGKKWSDGNPWTSKGAAYRDEDSETFNPRNAIEKVLSPEKNVSGSNIAAIFAKAATTGSYDSVSADLAAHSFGIEVEKATPHGTPAKWSGNSFGWDDEIFTTPTTRPASDVKHELPNDTFTPALMDAITQAIGNIDEQGDNESEQDYFARIDRELERLRHKPLLTTHHTKSTQDRSSQAALIGLAEKTLQAAKAKS